jgi:sulfonate transport system permease protein
MLGVYVLLSGAQAYLDASVLPAPVSGILRPDVLPPAPRVLNTLVELIGAHADRTHPTTSHAPGHLATLLEEHVTLQGSLLVTALRVVVGLATGVPLGVFLGALMGWSRRLDDYLHPLYVLIRSIPPIALVTYLMLWLGHGEAHLVVPVGYAGFVTMVIPAYHAVRDVPETYLMAARALGARGWLLARGVVLPAASPVVLAGLRYALVVGWMTVVGVEMLMADAGVGRLLVGGGLWSSRLTLAVDPAVVVVGLLGLAAAGYASDAFVRLLARELTHWSKP